MQNGRKYTHDDNVYSQARLKQRLRGYLRDIPGFQALRVGVSRVIGVGLEDREARGLPI